MDMIPFVASVMGRRGPLVQTQETGGTHCFGPYIYSVLGTFCLLHRRTQVN